MLELIIFILRMHSCVILYTTLFRKAEIGAHCRNRRDSVRALQQGHSYVCYCDDEVVKLH